MSINEFLSLLCDPIDLPARACGFRVKISEFQKFLNAFIQSRFCQIHVRDHIINLANWFWPVDECPQYFLVRHSARPTGGHSGCREWSDLYCNHSEVSNFAISNHLITKSGITKWTHVNAYGNDSLGTYGPISNVVNTAREWAECGRAGPMIKREPHDRGRINARRPQKYTEATSKHPEQTEVRAA